MKPIILFALTLFTCISSLNAQELKYELSEPVDIPLAGWNKVLTCSNGNTLLFHFEPRKGIIVKVFDANHKEIISKKHICELLDINTLDRTHLNWITEINKEAVLFFTQQVENRQTLLRLRVNTSNGNLIEESKVIQSPSFKNSITSLIQDIPGIDDYYVICCMRNEGKDSTFIKRYDKDHLVISEIPVNINPKEYDYTKLSTKWCNSNGGILLGFDAGKKIEDGKYDKFILFYYFVKGDTGSIQAKLQMPSDFYFTNGSLTFNPFDKRMNYIVLSQTEEKNEHNETLSYKDYFLVSFSEDLTDFHTTALQNKKVKDILHQQIDSNQIFMGSIDGVFTNERGQTSVFYQGYTYNKSTAGYKTKNGSIPNFSITQINGDGDEIWGTSIPYSRLRTKNDYPRTFGMVSEYGLLQQSYFRMKDNYYLLFNETESGFAKQNMSEAIDSAFNVDFTRATYYKLDKKRTITKKYLWGVPKENEYLQFIANSMSYKGNTVTTLIRHRKGKEVTSEIAWIQLEP